jgi:N-acetylmuramoyl-L-alanine amidase CwlA
MCGDNNSMVDSSMQLNAKLHMWHTKTIASGILGFYFLPGENNPADILDKHRGYTQIKEN